MNIKFKPPSGIVWYAASYGAGIVLSAHIISDIAVCAALAASAAACIALWRCNRRGILFAALCVLWAAFGYTYASVAQITPEPPPEAQSSRVNAMIYGSVTYDEEGGTNRAKFYISDIEVDGEAYSGRAAVTIYGAPKKLEHGMRVSITGRVYHPQGKRNPGGFDYNAFLMRRGAYFCVSSGAVEITGEPGGDFIGSSIAARRAMERRLDDVLAHDVAGVAKALLLGSTHDVDEDTYQAFLKTGILHVLSVSGLHVGFLALSISAVMRLFFGKKQRYAAFFITLPMLCAYAFVTGGAPPIIRAVIMYCVFELVRMGNIKYDGLSSLAIAFILYLIYRPLELFEAGFGLSFTAMLGISLLYRPLLQLFKKLPKYLAQTLAVTFAAQLGSMPLSINLFHRLTVFSFAVNCVIVPLVSIIMPALFITAALSLVWAAAAAKIAFICNLLLRLMLLLVDVAVDMPLGYLTVASAPVLTVLAAYACAIVCSQLFEMKLWLRASACVVIAALALSSWGISLKPLENAVDFVDVGQGAASAVHSSDGLIIIDAGMPNRGLCDYILNKNTSVAAVIITHPHEDHFGGLGDMLEYGISIGGIYIGDFSAARDVDDGYYKIMTDAENAGIPIHIVKTGEVLQFGSASVEVVGPPAILKRPDDSNSLSLQLRVEVAGGSVLFMGDAPIEAESAGMLPAAVLHAAHHGSNGSTSSWLIDEVRPALAVISVGYNNYGHPAPSALERLQAGGVTVLRTDKTGCLRVEFTNGAINWTAFAGQKEDI